MAAFSLKNNPIANYVRESAEELRKVTWPSRQTIMRDTLVVIGISAAVGVFFGALDYGLSAAFEQLLKNL